jgi:hypothetical protein
MSIKSFEDYLEEKQSMNVEKPAVEKVPDYHGKPNPFIKKSPERKVSGGEGAPVCPCKAKVEEVPDFHGPSNPDVKKPPKQKVVEVSSFREYMDAKGKIVAPTVSINMKSFPSANAPPADPHTGGKPLPYIGSKMTAKAGLGDEGSIDAWSPKTNPKKDSVESELLKGTKGKGQPQAESISNKSLVELTSYLSKQNRLLAEGSDDSESDDIPKVTSWAAGKIMPDPIETVEYITHLASLNTNLMEMLVRSLKKKKGGMGGLMGKVLDQPESFKELVGHLEGENGEKHAGSLCRAMSDAYNDFMQEHSMNESALSPPIGFDDEEEGGEEEDDTGDEYNDSDFEGDDEESEGDEFGGGEGDDEGFEDGNDEEGEEDEVPSMLPGEKDAGDEEPPPELPKRSVKPKRKFSHDHLIGAMAGHKHMLDSMTSHCKSCGSA